MSESFLQNLLLGGISGTIAKTSTAPLERTRILLQTQASNPSIVTKYKGPLDCLMRIPKEEGFLAFWRGNGINVMRYFPTQALNFAFKERFRQLFVPDKKSGFWKVLGGNLLSGAAAGATTLSIVYPLDLARTRIAALPANAEKGIRACFGNILKVDGVKGLYRGFCISVINVTLYRAGYFGIYDTIKPYFNDDFWSRYLVAQSGSLFTGVWLYPFDTVRKRLMMQSGRGADMQYTGAIDCLVKIVRNEGPLVLFNGYMANAFKGIGSSLVLVLYDELQDLVTEMKDGKAGRGDKF